MSEGDLDCRSYSLSCYRGQHHDCDAVDGLCFCPCHGLPRPLKSDNDLVSFGLYLTGGGMTRGDVERELGKWREQR